MIKYGTIQQYKGPFKSTDVITLEKSYKVGISIREKDFMKLGSQKHSSLQFNINGENIHMGRTCMYEVDNPIPAGTITFPSGAPQSVLVEVVYCKDEDE